MRDRLSAIALVFAALVWRGFGLFLFILGGSAGVGAVVSGSWITGVVIAWGTLMIGVIGALGYAIATTGHADQSTIHAAVNDAVKKVEADREKQ